MQITNIQGTVNLSNGVKMPYLGLGVYKTENGAEIVSAIHDAIDLGYRHIDTASFYKNEDGVGQAIKESNIEREKMFITTKVWNADHGYDNTLKAFDDSLNKLEMDYVDLYLIHWPVPNLYVETWKAMEDLYKQGKIKAIGVCNCLEHHIDDILKEGTIAPMVLQNEFHPRLVQQHLLDYCKTKNIQYEAWAPLMRGRILDNPILNELAKKYGKTTAQIILRWDLQKDVITIPKSTHKERIAANADIFDFELEKEDISKIDSLDTEERTGAHPDNFMDHFANK